MNPIDIIEELEEIRYKCKDKIARAEIERLCFKIAKSIEEEFKGMSCAASCIITAADRSDYD